MALADKRFGGRFLIQDSNHMSDINEFGGEFMIQDHDHMADIAQGQVDQSDDNDRQQGAEEKKSSKRRPGRQYL